MTITKRTKHLTFLSVLVFGFLLLWYLVDTGKLWFNMPPQYKYPVRGVDASHYQGTMDWNVIAQQGITFAFLKATEGSGTIDECFAENWENARAAGLYVGAYHFFSFDSAGATQAVNFTNVVPNVENALPPVIDLEYYRSENLPPENEVRENLRVLLEAMQETYGKKPIIYTTKACWEHYLEGSGLDYTLWIRSIITDPDETITPKWTFWQYNPRGQLNGYTGGDIHIDFNVFRGSMEQFKKFAGYDPAADQKGA